MTSRWVAAVALAGVVLGACGDDVDGSGGQATADARATLVDRCVPDCEDQNATGCASNDHCETYCEGRADEALSSGCVDEQLAMRDCWDAVGDACSLVCDPEVYAEIDCKDAYCATNAGDPVCPSPAPG